MNRTDIQRLQSIRGYPLVSILLPTHRTSPDNRQDPIRVRNLVAEAKKRLLAESPQRDVALVLQRIEALADQIDYRYVLDGLALFACSDFAAKFHLPFTVKERVVIGEAFAMRDLVFALNRSARYWVLVLSEDSTRLYKGWRDSLIEVTDGGFPIRREGPGATEPMPDRFGTSLSAYEDERFRQFFRQVVAAFSAVTAEDELPAVVAGIERYLAYFNNVSQNLSRVVAALTGSHDKTSAHELAASAWPLIGNHLAQGRQAALDALGVAVGARQSASGIGEVWRLAQEGRGAVLLVEEDFHYPARLDPGGMTLIPVDDPTALDVMEDAVDDLIQTVLAKGGRVVFASNGSLAAHQRIALILRY